MSIFDQFLFYFFSSFQIELFAADLKKKKFRLIDYFRYNRLLIRFYQKWSINWFYLKWAIVRLFRK